ncbi:MAG: hypothetical protein OHK0022_03560 [Roseiflexaceae bacterium]
MQTTPAWHSARIYYYTEDHPTDLLLDAVTPLLEQLRPAVPRALFLPHWLRGPHVRLRFHTDAALFEQVVKPALEQQIGAFLSARPSALELDPERMRPVYEHLAAEELEREQVLPLLPNNSIQYLPCDRRMHVLRDPELAAIMDDFLIEATAPALALLKTVRGGTSRLSLGFDLMVALAHGLTAGVTSGFLSYRSHAEVFIEKWPHSEATRALFETRYRARAPQLAARLQSVVEAVERGDGRVAFVAEWVALMRRFAQRLAGLVARITPGAMPPPHVDLPPEQAALINARVERSPFHAAINTGEWRRAALWNSSNFQIYRLLLNMQYIQLGRLGVRPFERYMLCHLVANTVEHVYGVSATTLLEQQFDRLAAKGAAHA